MKFRILIALWCALLSPNLSAQEIDIISPSIPPPVVETHPLRFGFGWRLGFVSSGLFGSDQGRPFFYFDTGLRFKNDHVFFDLKMPAFVGALDFLFFEFQKAIDVNTPFNLFESMNDPIHYGSRMEFANLKVGSTFLLYPFGPKPMRTTVGVFVSAEWVFFDLVLFKDRVIDEEDEEFDPAENPLVNDPIVIAPGGFVAFGGELPISTIDVAIGAGPDVFIDEAYAQNSGWVLFADMDTQIDLTEDVSAYIRTRVSTYTHTEKLVFTMDANMGVVVRLW